MQLDMGSFSETECATAVKISCGIPIPEPSAALSIPSGAAMMFALAKIRTASLIR
jgi:hypothetical protein